jgi:hypothetical protein
LRGRHTTLTPPPLPLSCCALLVAAARAAESFQALRPPLLKYCRLPIARARPYLSLGLLSIRGNPSSQSPTKPATPYTKTFTTSTSPAQIHLSPYYIPDPEPHSVTTERLGNTLPTNQPSHFKPPPDYINKMAYKGPEGPPPSYPPQAYDAGPYQQPGYGSPAPPMGGPGPYGPPPGGQQDYYGGQQQGYNQPPMQYQQQPMYPQQGYPPPQGQYQDNRRGGSSGSGICAGIMGALACCCCLDCLF